MRYCILGATGYIGNYLYRRMKEDSINVIGSSRSPLSFYFTFDVLKGDNCPKEFLEYQGAKVVIICFAQAKIDLCKTDYDHSYQINVTGTLKLIEKLKNNGCKVIVFSSDNVFGDNRGDYTEQDEVSPINHYGAMKAELETKIQQHDPETLILRLPKVVGIESDPSNLLTGYLSNLSKPGPDYAIKDSKMSIVSLEDIYQIIRSSCELNLDGLYQLCYEKNYSRADLANIFYSMIGAKKQVTEKSLDDFHFKDNRPVIMNMKNDKIKDATGHLFESYEKVVHQFIKINKNEIEKIIETM